MRDSQFKPGPKGHLPPLSVGLTSKLFLSPRAGNVSARGDRRTGVKKHCYATHLVGTYLRFTRFDLNLMRPAYTIVAGKYTGSCLCFESMPTADSHRVAAAQTIRHVYATRQTKHCL